MLVSRSASCKKPFAKNLRTALAGVVPKTLAQSVGLEIPSTVPADLNLERNRSSAGDLISDPSAIKSGAEFCSLPSMRFRNPVRIWNMSSRLSLRPQGVNSHAWHACKVEHAEKPRKLSPIALTEYTPLAGCECLDSDIVHLQATPLAGTLQVPSGRPLRSSVAALQTRFPRAPPHRAQPLRARLHTTPLRYAARAAYPQFRGKPQAGRRLAVSIHRFHRGIVHLQATSAAARDP